MFQIDCSPVSHSCCLLSAQRVCCCWMSSGVRLSVCDDAGRVRHWVGFCILRKPTRFCGTRGSDSCVCSHYPQIFLKIQHCTSKARLCEMTIWNTVSTHKKFSKIVMEVPWFVCAKRPIGALSAPIQKFPKIQSGTSKARLCKMTIWNTVSTHKKFPKNQNGTSKVPRLASLLVVGCSPFILFDMSPDVSGIGWVFSFCENPPVFAGLVDLTLV